MPNATPDTDSDIIYSVTETAIAVITLNRPQTRNSQDTDLLYALNAAFDEAANDSAVKVIVLRAEGPHFSSGHDLRETDAFHALDRHARVGTWGDADGPGCERWVAREKELYQGFSERWRNLPKPMIAAVQGKVIAGGLMVMWPCDIIVAAEDAQFCDNTVLMGLNGCEFFQHPYEMSARKAKEWLWTAGFMDAAEALRQGMVNHVVPKEQLDGFTMDLARKIAAMPALALKLTKEWINAADDAAGRQQVHKTAFAIHHLLHAQNYLQHDLPIDPRAVAQSIGRDQDMDALLRRFDGRLANDASDPT